MLKTAAVNVRKSPIVIAPCWMRPRPSNSSSATATAPRKSISGELIACTRTDRRFARNRVLAALRNRPISHDSMLNAFTIRLPVIVSCRMF